MRPRFIAWAVTAGCGLVRAPDAGPGLVAGTCPVTVTRLVAGTCPVTTACPVVASTSIARTAVAGPAAGWSRRRVTAVSARRRPFARGSRAAPCVTRATTSIARSAPGTTWAAPCVTRGGPAASGPTASGTRAAPRCSARRIAGAPIFATRGRPAASGCAAGSRPSVPAWSVTAGRAGRPATVLTRTRRSRRTTPTLVPRRTPARAIGRGGTAGARGRASARLAGTIRSRAPARLASTSASPARTAVLAGTGRGWPAPAVAASSLGTPRSLRVPAT